MRDIYKKILVAVDASEHAKEALLEAMAVAKRNNGSLDILHIKDETRLTGTTIGLSLSMESLEEEAKKLLAELEPLVDDSIEHEFHKYLGNPKREIVKFAEEEGIDLILMGANSKGLLERMLVGSTASYVVNHAPCNVMVVK